MTLVIKFGRRTNKNWMKRQVQKISGLLSFQENIWLVLCASISKAKKRANQSGIVRFVVTKKTESEDLHYNLEWLEITIQGSKEAELDELKDMENFYAPLQKIFKKDLPRDENLARHFKTKVISLESMEKAYKEGYGSLENKNLANKLLEMGILMVVEPIINDYDSRPIEIPGLN